MLSFQVEALLLGLLISLPIGWLAMTFSKKIHLIDVPGTAKHKLHDHPVPIAGGLTLVLSAGVLLFIFRQTLPPSFLAILLPALIIFAFGLLDDLRGLSAPIKLVGQVLAVLTMMSMGLSIHIFEHLLPQGNHVVWRMLPSFLDAFLTVFWIVGIVNAFNLIDSMDGLVSGISAWAFGFFVIAALDSQQITLSYFAAIFLGINLALSFYNTAPAKFFLGDSGAQTLGFLLAAISILYAPIYLVQASSWFVPILLLAVPIFDTCLVFFSRLRRRTPFYKANRDHTYHRLVNYGMDPRRAVFSLHITALIFQCVGMIAAALPPLLANSCFVLSLLIGLGAFFYLERPEFLSQA